MHGTFTILSKLAFCFPHTHASLSQYGCCSSGCHIDTFMFQAQNERWGNASLLFFDQKTKLFYQQIFTYISMSRIGSHNHFWLWKHQGSENLTSASFYNGKWTRRKSLGWPRASQLQCLPHRRISEGKTK